MLSGAVDSQTACSSLPEAESGSRAGGAEQLGLALLLHCRIEPERIGSSYSLFSYGLSQSQDTAPARGQLQPAVLNFFWLGVVTLV